MIFQRFVAIDWSGAKGRRHKGIAVAMAEAGNAAPVLIRPGHVWSRTEVLDWLVAQAAKSPTLFGFDFSFAPPAHERGAYLPGEPDVPAEARAFWAYVDALCDDEDLGAASLLERHHRRHFYFGAADGPKHAFLHHRACEKAFNATGGGKASTVYDAIGAAQVAKASFAGMRLLHRLDGRVPVWPFDPPPLPRSSSSSRCRPGQTDSGAAAGTAMPESLGPGLRNDGGRGGSLVVEIYTRLFIRAAGLSGRKVRDPAMLDQALIALGSQPLGLPQAPDDHATDVLIAAAGLRAMAPRPELWAPPALTPALAATEGWTFGVR